MSSIVLEEGERILWEDQPKASVLGVWFFTKGLSFVFAASFLTFWCFGFFGGIWVVATKQEGFNPLLTAGHALMLIVFLSIAGVIPYLIGLRQTYQYFVTNQRVIFVGGLLMKKRRSVHYHKVTDVEVAQNFIEQLLDIRTLKLFTAGTSAMGPWGERAEIEFQGLKEADRVEQLINGILKSYKATGE